MSTPIVTPVGAAVDEDDDIVSVKLKKISLEQLEADDLLVSVNSLMNFVEHQNFDAEQLKQLMCELVVAGQGGMLNDRSQATAQEFMERYANFVHECAPEHAIRNKMPWFEGRSKDLAADVRFFKNVSMRGTPEHRSDDPNWKADAEKRWKDAAQQRLAEITADLSRSVHTDDDFRQFSSRRYNNAVTA